MRCSRFIGGEGEREREKYIQRKHGGKRPLAEDFRRRWENDITTDVMEIIWNGVDWINLVRGRSGGLLRPRL